MLPLIVTLPCCSPVTGSATAQAGIIPACAIFKVGEAEVLRSTHDVVVACIKRSLDETASQDGGPSVKLKVSFPFVEQLTTYKYEENVNGTVVDLYERTVESPYTFSVPGEVGTNFIEVCCNR